MGSILQESHRSFHRERNGLRGGLRTVRGPDRRAADSQTMGKKQLQRRDQDAWSQDHIFQDRRFQQRRKLQLGAASTQHATPHISSQGLCGSASGPPDPAEDHVEPKVVPSAPRCSHREHKHSGVRGSRHSAALHRQSVLSRQQQERRPPRTAEREEHGADQEDSDTDLSECERLPVGPLSRVPPLLELRPEVVEVEERPSLRTRAEGVAAASFPDFLPPPFNSWNLSQLAVFYNAEGRGAPRPRAAGPLERYLEKLLQLEWRQIQTVHEESGRSAGGGGPFVSGPRPAGASTRLSSPKCILQCQRGFPLPLLSCLAGHSALLSGCSCSLCLVRYSACAASCCHSSRARQSRLGPSHGTLLEGCRHPKRSYSEGRVPAHPSSSSSSQKLSSPTRTNSHLRRMQASGNIRYPVHSTTSGPLTSSRDSGPPGSEEESQQRMGGSRRRRSGSEQRRGGLDRRQNGWEKRRSGSECRGRRAELKEREIKPDAVAAIMDNLPVSKYSPLVRTNRLKQVDFVT